MAALVFAWLCLDDRAQYFGPPAFEVHVPLQSSIQQPLDSVLRFRPRQRGLPDVVEGHRGPNKNVARVSEATSGAITMVVP